MSPGWWRWDRPLMLVVGIGGWLAFYGVARCGRSSPPVIAYRPEAVDGGLADGVDVDSFVGPVLARCQRMYLDGDCVQAKAGQWRCCGGRWRDGSCWRSHPRAYGDGDFVEIIGKNAHCAEHGAHRWFCEVNCP